MEFFLSWFKNPLVFTSLRWQLMAAASANESTPNHSFGSGKEKTTKSPRPLLLALPVNKALKRLIQMTAENCIYFVNDFLSSACLYFI